MALDQIPSCAGIEKFLPGYRADRGAMERIGVSVRHEVGRRREIHGFKFHRTRCCLLRIRLVAIVMWVVISIRIPKRP